MSTSQIPVFVCGPTLHGEVLKRITVRKGAVVWEDGDEPAPLLVEPIRAIQPLPVAGPLVLLVTNEALYLTTINDLPEHLFS